MSEPKVIYSNPFIFTVTSMGIMGGLIGLIFGVANGSGPIGLIFGAFFMVLILGCGGVIVPVSSFMNFLR